MSIIDKNICEFKAWPSFLINKMFVRFTEGLPLTKITAKFTFFERLIKRVVKVDFLELVSIYGRTVIIKMKREEWDNSVSHLKGFGWFTLLYSPIKNELSPKEKTNSIQTKIKFSQAEIVAVEHVTEETAQFSFIVLTVGGKCRINGIDFGVICNEFKHYWVKFEDFSIIEQNNCIYDCIYDCQNI